jgi:ubiquinol-cytochrome c reductase iron-sulfur subunit
MSDTHDLVVPEAQEPIPDPGLPEHEERLTDAYVASARRAERQVATLFGASMICALGFCVAYFMLNVGDHPTKFFGLGASNVVLGLALGLCLLFIGMGAIHWARMLMTDHEIVEYRHPASSSEEDRTEAVAAFTTGVEESGIGRRPLIRNSLIGALGMLGLPAIVALRDLGPLPGDKLWHTVWRKGMRVVQDVDGALIKPSDMVVGQLVNCEPDVFFETKSNGEPKYEGTRLLQEKAKAAVILVRMDPADITPTPDKANWGINGILCYSKICTHVGCPISLWEQQTHHLLCPCHQSTFDLADNGKVVFGPAARPLPQLPITTDSEGYIVAQSDFHQPVGPSFWERG